MKPLSEKTLEKMYIKANITKKESEIMHRYFKCFANLYGFISSKEIWELFNYYEKDVSKEKLYAFIDIVEREENDTYEIYPVHRVFNNPDTDKNKVLINKFLIDYGTNKFTSVYQLENQRNDEVYFYRPEKQELFTFKKDLFYDNAQGKRMVKFINNIRTSGEEENEFFKGKTIHLYNLDEGEIVGKKFCNLRCYNSLDAVLIKCETRPHYLENLKQKTDCFVSEKILGLIKESLLLDYSNREYNSIKMILDRILAYGGRLDEDEVQEFVSLYMELNNNSNLWCNCGWQPVKLLALDGIKGPFKMSLGPNIRRMIDNKEIDINELKEACDEIGVDILDPSKYS